MVERYKREEMVPSIEVVKKMADLLDTRVGYLLGETVDMNTFKKTWHAKTLQ